MSKSIFEPTYETLRYNYDNNKTALVTFDQLGSLIHANQSFMTLFNIADTSKLMKLNLFDSFGLTDESIDELRMNNSLEVTLSVDLALFSRAVDNTPVESDTLQLDYCLEQLPHNDYLLSITRHPKLNENYENLLKSDPQLTLALAEGNVCLWELDFIHNTVYYSENFYTWFDYDAHYLENDANAFFNLVHPNDVERFKQEIQDYFDNNAEEFVSEYRVLKNDNEFITLRTTGSATRNQFNEVVRFTGINIDVTRKRQETTELHELEEDLHKLFDHMITGFVLHKIIKDDTGKACNYDYRFVNPAYERLTGLSKKTVLGKKVTDIFEHVDSHWIERYARVAINGETLHFQDFAGPEQKFYDVIAYQTRPDYFAVIFTDISDKLKIDEALKRADKLNSIGQLAGGIAHDFNNHLQIIRSYCDLLNDKIPNGKNHELLDFVDNIQSSVSHSTHMIRQLLAFSKGGYYNLRPIDLHLLLHQTKNILNYSINRNVQLQLVLEADFYQIIGDEPMMQNALINMCLNSRDALPNGGIIQIVTHNLYYHKDTIIENQLLEAGQYIIMSIRDNGLGIAPENIRHIFEPFYTTKPTQGTGMGLAAVYGTIKNHKGAITVTSNPEEWTNFDIYLKVSDKDVNYERQHTIEEKEAFVPYKLLLVDDEPVISLVIKQYLKDLGYDIDIYTSSISALEALQASNTIYDLYILDVIMPDMSGFDLLKEIVNYDNKAKAIFLSGYFNPDEVDDSLQDYILDFIGKPVKLEELHLKIQSLLNT